jgi:hypothetical protein
MVQPAKNRKCDKRGIEVAQSTVSIYMVPRQDRPLQTWKTFLRNHAEGIASIDLFVVPTIAFEQLFAFLVLQRVPTGVNRDSQSARKERV